MFFIVCVFPSNININHPRVQEFYIFFQRMSKLNLSIYILCDIISVRPRLNSRIITGKGQRTHSCLERGAIPSPHLMAEESQREMEEEEETREREREGRPLSLSLISSKETFNRVRYARGISIADRRANPPSPLFLLLFPFALLGAWPIPLMIIMAQSRFCCSLVAK